MKVSLITVCRNVAPVIAESIDSILGQEYPEIELIVIDGASTDGTLDILNAYGSKIDVLLSEPDNGIYDAMNKGLARATGDVIGFVNAGDLLMTSRTIDQVVKAFEQQAVDAVYGDIIMVEETDITKIKRTWLSGAYNRNRFKEGWMPPHVATFIRKSAYDAYGQFKTELRIAADYEILFRMLYKERIATVHLSEILVRFRLGGMSNGSVKHVLKANTEVRRSWRLNGFQAPPLLVTRKLWSKVMQFFH